MENMRETWVVAGHLLCCSAPATTPGLEDVKRSLLFAQLKADSVGSRFQSSKQWFAEHNNALRMLKWSGNEFEGGTFEPGPEHTVELSSIVEQTLLSDLTTAQAEHIRQAIDCLVSGDRTEAHQLFDDYALALPSTEQAVGPASEAETAVALLISVLEPGTVLKSLWITFKTSAELTQDLFRQPFTGEQISGTVETQLFRRRWNAAGYQRVRERVEASLAGREKTLIMPLACPGSSHEAPALFS
jgi:hypothetical protein